MKYVSRIIILALTVGLLGLLSCSDNEPKKEDTPELITKVTLTYMESGQAPITVTATDPDGDGVQDIAVDGPIVFVTGKTYIMSIGLINGLVAAGQPGYDITEEVADEGDEHQFFFTWTGDLFADPTGNGNVDVASDPVNYTGGANSKDLLGQNLGLTTTWTTGSVPGTGTFRIVLKHQPGAKTSSSGATVGETDLDITFDVIIN